MNPVLNAPLGPDGLPLPVDPQRVQQFFEDFYEDLFLELTQYGQIESLCVCDNIADHMVGNVYVKFRDEESAAKAVKGVQGRYYAGKQISAEFSPVMDFKESTCRQYEEGTCNRGGYCNFMHVRPAGPEVRVQCFGRYGALTSADTRSRVLTLSLALRATRFARSPGTGTGRTGRPSSMVAGATAGGIITGTDGIITGTGGIITGTGTMAAIAIAAGTGTMTASIGGGIAMSVTTTATTGTSTVTTTVAAVGKTVAAVRKTVATVGKTVVTVGKTVAVGTGRRAGTPRPRGERGSPSGTRRPKGSRS